MKSLLLILALLAQVPAPSQTGDRVITGKLLDVSGKPAMGIRVAAMEAPESAGRPVDAALVRLTETDASGNYRLENLPRGRYYVLAGSLENPTYYPGAAILTGATVVTIPTDGKFEALNFSMSPDNQSGIIQVVVERRDTGAPIVGAQVTIRSSSAGTSVISAITDFRGQVVAGSLASGQYSINVQHENYVSNDVSPTGSSVGAGGVTISPERKEGRLVFNLNPGAVIAGRVQTSTGRVVSAARVTVMRIGYQEGRTALIGVGGIGTVGVDAQGQYRIGSLVPGEYYLHVEDRTARVLATSPNDTALLTYYPGVTQTASAKPLKLAIGEIRNDIDIVIPTASGVTISGTILNSLPGGQPTANGVPYRGVVDFSLVPRDSGLVDTALPLIQNMIAYSGRGEKENEVPFEIRGIPPGEYNLYPLSASGTGGSFSTGRTPIAVGSQNIGNVAITLRPNSEIRGRVTVEGEIPSQQLGTLRVRLRPKEFLPTLIRTGANRASVVLEASDAGGRDFVIADVPEARFGILVAGISPTVYVSDIRQSGRSVYVENAIDVHSGTVEPIEIILRAGAASSLGTVRNAANNIVPNAFVVLQPSGTLRQNSQLYKSTTTSPSGEFTMSGIAPGEYTLFAFPSPPGGNAEENPEFMAKYESQGQRIHVDSSQQVRTDLKLIADPEFPDRSTNAAPQITNRVVLEPNTTILTAQPAAASGNRSLAGSATPNAVSTLGGVFTLLQQGRALTAAQADVIEARLQSSPDSLPDRTLLLGFYSPKRNDPVYAEKRRGHVLWVIRNYPSNLITRQTDAQFDNYEPEFATAREIWQKHVADQPNDSTILLNAGTYFITSDPALAERFFLKGQLLQPGDANWPTQLGQIYSLKARFPTVNNISLTPVEAATKALEEFEKANAISYRANLIAPMADMARRAGDPLKAFLTASAAVRSTDPDSVHNGNLILGEMALEKEDTSAAKDYLLAAGKAGSSPVLSSFGPGMKLANDLLKKGERDTVQTYLEECLTFWKSGQDRLKGWIDSIKKGETPTLASSTGN